MSCFRLLSESAVRRFVIERARAAGDLGMFQSMCHQTQFSEVFLFGRAAWEIEYIKALKHDRDDDLREFIGTFDGGGYVHLVFVPDDFEEVAHEGIVSIHRIKGIVQDRIRDRAACLAAKPDFRRGLTVLVHGGIGREFSPLCRRASMWLASAVPFRTRLHAFGK